MSAPVTKQFKVVERAQSSEKQAGWFQVFSHGGNWKRCSKSVQTFCDVKFDKIGEKMMALKEKTLVTATNIQEGVDCYKCTEKTKMVSIFAFYTDLLQETDHPEHLYKFEESATALS